MKAFADRIRATISRPEDGEIILDDPDGPMQSPEPHNAEEKAGEEERWGGGERRGT